MSDSLDALLSRAGPRQPSAGRRAPPLASPTSLPSGGSGSYGTVAASSSMGPPVARTGSIGGGGSAGTPHSTPSRGGSATASRDPYATPATTRSDSFSSSSSAHNRTSSGLNGSSSAFGSTASFSGTSDMGASGSEVRHGRRAGSAAPKRPDLPREPSAGPTTPTSAMSAPSPSHAAAPKMRASINDPLPSLGGGGNVARQPSSTAAPPAAAERPLPGPSGGAGTIPAGAGEAPTGEPTVVARQGSAARAAPPVQCPDCGRKFKRTSFIIHQRACKRVFRTKRAEYDSQKARVSNTDAAAYVNKSNGMHTEDTESDSDDGKGGKKPRVLAEGDIPSDGDEPDDEPVRPRTGKKEKVDAKKIPGGPLVVISKKTGKASTVMAAPKVETKAPAKGAATTTTAASARPGTSSGDKPKWKDQSESLRQAMKAARASSSKPSLAPKTGIDVVKISRTK